MREVCAVGCPICRKSWLVRTDHVPDDRVCPDCRLGHGPCFSERWQNGWVSADGNPIPVREEPVKPGLGLQAPQVPVEPEKPGPMTFWIPYGNGNRPPIPICGFEAESEEAAMAVIRSRPDVFSPKVEWSVRDADSVYAEVTDPLLRLEALIASAEAFYDSRVGSLLRSLTQKRDALRRERGLPPIPPTGPKPPPVAVVKPERPRPDVLKIHRFVKSGDNPTRSKLRVLDEAIAIASGDDLRWLTNEREALVLRERRERPKRRKYAEERASFFGKTKAKVQRGRTKTKPPRGH